MQKVLFVCIHNSARSQMAEAFLNKLGDGKFAAESAGIEPGTLNPIVAEAMLEVGFDISTHTCDSVERFIPRAKEFDYLITVCDETAAERCPTFPGEVKCHILTRNHKFSYSTICKRDPLGCFGQKVTKPHI